MIEAYPLHWPGNKPRSIDRKRANFGKRVEGEYYNSKKSLTMHQAVTRLIKELGAYTRVGHTFRVPKDSIIISTNVPVKKDGFPVSNYRQPTDPGVAVYFTLDGQPYCLPCDKWDRVEDNIAAVAAHVGAMRSIERWGVGESHDHFTGFKAIPEKATGRSCWDILEIPPTKETKAIDTAYRTKCKFIHPDATGTNATDEFVELVEAKKQAYLYANGLNNI